jgi:GT2 family glycosyltransferase
MPLFICDFVLHDGALLSLDVTRSVGFPRADFFIMLDEVEYCARIRRAGWRVLLLNEHLAEQGHMGSTGPWRGYYQTRNELLMAREQRSLVSLWGWGVRQAKFTAGHLAYSDQKFQRLRYRVLGAWDGVRGVSGRTVDPRAS